MLHVHGYIQLEANSVVFCHSLTIALRWGLSKNQKLALGTSLPTSAEITGIYCHAQLLGGYWGFELRSQWLQSKHSYPLTISLAEFLNKEEHV